jgi:hypothetical protein
MPEPIRCTVCGHELPGHDFPGASTCQEWAGAEAARLVGLLTEDTNRELMLTRSLCQRYATIRDTIGEP